MLSSLESLLRNPGGLWAHEELVYRDYEHSDDEACKAGQGILV